MDGGISIFVRGQGPLLAKTRRGAQNTLAAILQEGQLAWNSQATLYSAWPNRLLENLAAFAFCQHNPSGVTFHCRRVSSNPAVGFSSFHGIRNGLALYPTVHSFRVIGFIGNRPRSTSKGESPVLTCFEILYSNSTSGSTISPFIWLSAAPRPNHGSKAYYLILRLAIRFWVISSEHIPEDISQLHQGRP